MERYLQHLLLLLAAADIVSCQNPVHSRIVGGTDGNIADYSWQVSINYLQLPACGGSMISNQWLVTACHCFLVEHKDEDYDIVAGTTNLSPPDAGAEVQSVDKVVRHPYYNPNSYSYDIALVRLKGPFQNAGIIKLPAASVQIPAGLGCVITGWGNIRHSDPLPSPKTLQVGRVTVISQKTCNCLYHINPTADSITTIQPDMLCAGSVQGSVDACQGDSGGPLSCYVNGDWFQVGLVSWGEECGAPNRPGVFIALVTYSDWIKGFVPEAQVVNFDVQINPTPDDENGCKAADGNTYPYPNGATSLLVTFLSLPLYWLTAYLLTNL